MKVALILIVSLFAGFVSAEHWQSYVLGLSIATLAVASCYWFAFRSTRFPELALFLLLCGMMAKLIVTVAGVAWGLSADLITSPIVFALSYLYFSIMATFVWFTYRDRFQAKYSEKFS
ncbi:NADH:ubiquinone oxidoreductase [Vibrio marisflavi]|uniref:NADH:ubiquinone oxidoreductase n=1 Tax=Vibrio marisflavi CECT 7928 TaxID=634439 RepID=A0ABM8ZZ97_9VIBR|nr:NADH:ubiquinone oxidoreductase [Vibrio marisflavi]CAH0536357.1 hypothetical protein VMF7928_00370 [Vibrio marisflavi CECT 7928]